MSTSAKERPMRADARRNYERLLTEAKGAFLEHGADAPLEDIARRAGVGIGTLYRHFPTRLALQEAVYRDQVESLVAAAYDLAETLPPGEALAAWMRSFVESARTKRGLMQTLKAVIDKHSELFARCHEEIREAVGLVLARAQESGTVRPDLTVPDLLKLIHALSVATEHAPPQDIDRLLSFLLDGLRSQP
ncbi:TetR/AcrR family transcriptional regulator [Actinomadura sp. HBU206391]|uniref:TetR/AcrR family transcriptional regulator n=1 Tax=Actinomadura sp. HBU206391 TaxID=2731692 RepID=UPI001650CC5D|nr:TetR/AcrR family transcriptional regulator [Actinomadura sp. HBU206391]MBC6463228.1 TetR/AcrR family transcriptional regulator [Actinomadura sp. HBU206391]